MSPALATATCKTQQLCCVPSLPGVIVIQQQVLSAPVPRSGRQARSEAKVITKKFSNQETILNTGQSMRGEGVGITQSGGE